MALRKRATAIVLNERGDILMVKNRGLPRYSLPGGGLRRNEPCISAAAREVYEETGIEVHSIRWVLDYDTYHSGHCVFLAAASGEPYVRSEIDTCRWWDQSEELPLYAYVVEVLTRAAKMGLIDQAEHVKWPRLPL